MKNILFGLCIYLLSVNSLLAGSGTAGELRLSPDECQNWGRVAAIAQKARQSDLTLEDVLKGYQKQLDQDKSPRNPVEVMAVKHMINEVFKTYDKDFPFMGVFQIYYASCMEKEGLVYRNTDI